MPVAEDRLNGQLVPEASFTAELETVDGKQVMVGDRPVGWPRRRVVRHHSTHPGARLEVLAAHIVRIELAHPEHGGHVREDARQVRLGPSCERHLFEDIAEHPGDLFVSVRVGAGQAEPVL
jgi:hypothetical protein